MKEHESYTRSTDPAGIFASSVSSSPSACSSRDHFTSRIPLYDNMKTTTLMQSSGAAGQGESARKREREGVLQDGCSTLWIRSSVGSSFLASPRTYTPCSEVSTPNSQGEGQDGRRAQKMAQRYKGNCRVRTRMPRASKPSAQDRRLLSRLCTIRGSSELVRAVTRAVVRWGQTGAARKRASRIEVRGGRARM